ncbi:MAG: nitroreductase family deazaflavin-dependent oxidoreductase [Anaerolineales bacterium]|nr:nitroreductase family deazaflavin-dependent oxidoreductase [Anaerolineales bacterium]
MCETSERKPPRGWLKFLFKVPVYVARMGFAGWERLIGVEWMLLTTVGRKSGKKRSSMVDVLVHDRATDTYYIEVGFGVRSDWYRNIQASPTFVAQVGRRTFRATAEELPAERTADVMVDCFRRQPKYFRRVMKMVGITFSTEEELRRMAPRWLLLAIHPQE